MKSGIGITGKVIRDLSIGLVAMVPVYIYVHQLIAIGVAGAMLIFSLIRWIVLQKKEKKRLAEEARIARLKLYEQLKQENEERFWKTLEDARPAINDLIDYKKLLYTSLFPEGWKDQPKYEGHEWDEDKLYRYFREKHQLLNTAELLRLSGRYSWGEKLESYEGFLYFRTLILVQGKQCFERALENPQGLLSGLERLELNQVKSLFGILHKNPNRQQDVHTAGIDAAYDEETTTYFEEDQKRYQQNSASTTSTESI